jgi:hypothetical protein
MQACAHLEHLAVGLHASIHVAGAYCGVPILPTHGCIRKIKLLSTALDSEELVPDDSVQNDDRCSAEDMIPFLPPKFGTFFVLLRCSTMLLPDSCARYARHQASDVGQHWHKYDRIFL